MPFQSEKQRRFLHANHPEIAKRWESEYATGGISNHFRRRLGLKKGSDGPGPGGQGARGQATQNPGSSGGPPGGGSGGQGGAMHYQAPTPTYQNVHQTGAISQTPGQTITTTGDGKTGDHHPPIRPKKTYGPYTPKNKYLPHYPALSKWQKEKVKDIITRAKKGTHGGYGPYSDTWTKIQHQPSLSKWQKKEFKDWETLVKKGAHGGYGPYTPPVDLGLVEELSTKDYKNLTSKFDTGEGWDTEDSGIGFKMSDLGIDKFSTDDNIQLAKVFNTKQDLQSIGAAKEGYWDTLTDQGEALEEFRKNATSMNQGDYYKGLGVQSQFNQLLENENKNATENKDFIQKAINEGFLKDESDFVNQKPLDDAVDLKAKGGVARKNYFHGGILDINESEEIISDDGNDIELTAYNAEFDDPKDLSTGVKSLFQAKDGGTPRRSYFTGAYGVGGTENTGGSTNRERGIQQAYSQPAYSPTGDASVAEQIAAGDRQRKQELKDLVATGPGSAEEKYSDYSAKEASDLGGYTGTKRGQLYSTRTRIELEGAQKIQREKLNKWGLGQLGKLGVMLVGMLAMKVPLGDALQYLPKTISLSKEDLGTLLKVSIPVMKAKKEHLKALDEYKTALLGQVDILNPNEMKSKIGTNISDITNEINDLTRTPEDDTKGDGGDGGIELPPQLGGPSTEEMATEYGMSNLDRIRAGQAKYAAYIDKIEREKLAREENPIVGTTEMDIIALRNSGGLANLFRVKNQ